MSLAFDSRNCVSHCMVRQSVVLRTQDHTERIAFVSIVPQLRHRCLIHFTVVCARRPAHTHSETISSSLSLSILYGQEIGNYKVGLGAPTLLRRHSTLTLSPSTGRHVRCSTLTTLEDGSRGPSGSLLLELSRDSVSRADATSATGQTEGFMFTRFEYCGWSL